MTPFSSLSHQEGIMPGSHDRSSLAHQFFTLAERPLSIYFFPCLVLWDGWMTSPTWWTWVWVNSGSWWWTGRPGVLRFTESKRVGHDWATELNWTELITVRARPALPVPLVPPGHLALRRQRCGATGGAKRTTPAHSPASCSSSLWSFTTSLIPSFRNPLSPCFIDKVYKIR